MYKSGFLASLYNSTDLATPGLHSLWNVELGGGGPLLERHAVTCSPPPAA